MAADHLDDFFRIKARIPTYETRVMVARSASKFDTANAQTEKQKSSNPPFLLLSPRFFLLKESPAEKSPLEMRFSNFLTLTLLSSTTYLLRINRAVIAFSQLSSFRQSSNPATNASTLNPLPPNNTLNKLSRAKRLRAIDFVTEGCAWLVR